MFQCPTCGSNVLEGATVCPDCGMDLKNVARPAAPSIAMPPEAPGAEPAATSLLDLSNGALPDEFDSVQEQPDAMNPAPAQAAPDQAAPGGASLTLKRHGTLTTETFLLGPRVIVGRFDPESGPVDVDLGPLPEASYISRHHAELWCEAGQWFIKDLGSRNGSFVRAAGAAQFVRVSGEQSVGDGDEVALGNARFEFHVG